MIKRWGEIKHPTLQDIANMVLKAVQKYGAEDVMLWKMDLSAAFNLMDFSAKSARLLAFELTEGMSAVHTTGMFGWTGTPYVFQVITRVLTDLCREDLVGLMLMYVDDMMGACSKKDLEADMAKAGEMARALLGSKAVAEDKSASGRHLDVIGWHFDMDTMTVSASKKNLMKAVGAFFAADVNGTMNLDQVQRMASYASRYATLCRQMKPYTSALYKCVPPYRGNRSVLLPLSERAKTDVVAWRAFLSLLHLEPARYARSLSTFRRRRPSVLIGYDASLFGFGVGVSALNHDGSQYELLGYTRLVIPYAVTNDSSFQNNNEYLAVLLGLALIKQEALVPRGFAYNLVGDNVTSLSWCAKERAASSIARRANIGFSLVTVEMEAYIAETRHIAGKYNIVYDGLSRGKEGVEVGLPPHLYVELTQESMAWQYIALCDPAIPLQSVDDHTSLSHEFLRLLEAAPPLTV